MIRTSSDHQSGVAKASISALLEISVALGEYRDALVLIGVGRLTS